MLLVTLLGSIISLMSSFLNLEFFIEAFLGGTDTGGGISTGADSMTVGGIAGGIIAGGKFSVGLGEILKLFLSRMSSSFSKRTDLFL